MLSQCPCSPAQTAAPRRLQACVDPALPACEMMTWLRRTHGMSVVGDEGVVAWSLRQAVHPVWQHCRHEDRPAAIWLTLQSPRTYSHELPQTDQMCMDAHRHIAAGGGCISGPLHVSRHRRPAPATTPSARPTTRSAWCAPACDAHHPRVKHSHRREARPSCACCSWQHARRRLSAW
jgi:hypothetical protein